MLTPNMVAKNEAEKKLLQAIFTFLTVKFSIVILSSVALLVVLLYLLSVLLDALFQICGQIAQVYGQSSPIEKLLLFVLIWALIAWVLRCLKRSSHHASV